jgi:lipopolysaccharide export system permease protein
MTVVKRLDSYIFREMMVPAVIGTVAVALMFMANQLIYLLKEYPLQTTPPLVVFQLILLKTPGWLQLTLPIGSAMGASLAISRLARESEITAMRAAGVSILRLLLPVAAFGAIIGVGNYLLVEEVMPRSEAQFIKRVSELNVASVAPILQENVQLRLDKYQAFIGSVQRTDGGAVLLEDILLIERPEPGQMTVVAAKTGHYCDGLWVLQEPEQMTFERAKLVNTLRGETMEIDQRIVIESLADVKGKSELTRLELGRAIARSKAERLASTDLEIEYHTRSAVPVSCLVFALVAPVFAILFARGGGFVGVLLSLAMVMLYYNLYIISTEVLGRNQIVAPWLSAWLPNFIFSALGLVAIRRLE